MRSDAETIHDRPAELLQHLIRFDTTNPPGNEAACIRFISDLLTGYGFVPQILAKDPLRPNLVTRLKGAGKSPPLLFYGHVDVVQASAADWRYPPFEGLIKEGCVWGRGALDMKGGIAMMLSALLRAKKEGLVPSGDVVLAIVSDEENGGTFGANYLVQNHPELFDGIQYAVGEFGGFSFYLNRKKFYPIQVCEKQICWLTTVIQGASGHGSFKVRGGTMARLGTLLTRLDRRPMPVHVTPVAEQMIKSIADQVSYPMQRVLRSLLNPVTANPVLRLFRPHLDMFDPLLHHTINPTCVQGGDKINVIPDRIQLKFDCRLLPGFHPQDVITELRNIVGQAMPFHIIQHDPSPPPPNMGLFDLLAKVLIKADADAIPIPLLLQGTTDARFFAKLGIQSYGFIPMNLPKDFKFFSKIHAANECIPLSTLAFGAKSLYALIRQYR